MQREWRHNQPGNIHVLSMSTEEVPLHAITRSGPLVGRRRHSGCRSTLRTVIGPAPAHLSSYGRGQGGRGDLNVVGPVPSVGKTVPG